MKASKIAAVLWAFAMAAPAHARVPEVVADIPPVHSLIAMVMEGVGEPDLLLPPGASPHGYAMTPSTATMLDRADLVFWTGERLTPWLERTIEALAGDAAVIELLELPAMQLLEFREGSTFEGHDTHPEGQSGHQHGRDGADPHFWLDPQNAAVVLDAAALALAAADPANAGRYRQNAAAGKAELDRLYRELEERLAPVRRKPFVVFHDAYHYFETRFEIEAVGAIRLADGASPSPARIAEVRGLIGELDAACVFSEPQFEPPLVATVIQGTGARRGTLDPLGAELPLGPQLYPQLLRNLADDLLGCLG